MKGSTDIANFKSKPTAMSFRCVSMYLWEWNTNWYLVVEDVVARGGSKIMCKEERDKKTICFIQYGDKK